MDDYILGIDVSRYQKEIDWKTVAASGEIRFAAIRATIGSIYKDPYFIQNWNGAKEAGLLVTAYHVIRWDADPEAQVENLVTMLNAVTGQNDLPIVLDVELPVPASRSTKHRKAVEYTARFAEIFDSTMLPQGYLNTMVYTGGWWWRPAWVGYSAGPSAVHVFPKWLWTADYTVGATDTGAYPPWNNWSMWQYSSSGTVDGVVGRCDMNRVDKESEFYEVYFTHQPDPPEPEPPEPEEQVIVVNTHKPVTIIINSETQL